MRDGDWKNLKVDGNNYLLNTPGYERGQADMGNHASRWPKAKVVVFRWNLNRTHDDLAVLEDRLF